MFIENLDLPGASYSHYIDSDIFAMFGTRKFRAAPCLTGPGWVWALGGLECASEAEHPFEFKVVPDLVGFELRWHEHPSSPLRGRSDMVG